MPLPDRGVHHADALHFEHEFVLRQRGVLRPEPVETFGSADFLDVDVLEQSLEMMHPLFDVRANIGADGSRSSGIDVAKKPASISSLMDVPKNVEYKSICRKARDVGAGNRARSVITRPSFNVFWGGVRSR